MDNLIPESGGITATCLLKNNEAVKSIPVVYFSGNCDLRFLAKQAGADAYLAKPFNLDV